MYYDKDGTPLSMSEFAKKFESDRVVAFTKLWKPAVVSTIWLGIDHNFGLTGKPVIFESMLFIGDGSSDIDMDRYCTIDEAKAGHKRMVRKWFWRIPFILLGRWISKIWRKNEELS